ncbi:hypothetical protein QBC36DRAFT_369893 [Triangularia setosa]|uniref:Uncharacterized protein n=1 Tax=Triangularia setosa TaxID=2587417 RepID=A0AAN7A2C3_9PEZI|nr:hypothetical protein QBC36DRAFT_369893 [Podospora setosa]
MHFATLGSIVSLILSAAAIPHGSAASKRAEPKACGGHERTAQFEARFDICDEASYRPRGQELSWRAVDGSHRITLIKQSKMTKPLRHLTAEKFHGPKANPSQLGDSISLKTETNSANPNPRREAESEQGLPIMTRKFLESSERSHEERMLREEGHYVSGMMADEIWEGLRGLPRKSSEGDLISLRGRECRGML